MEYLNVNKQAWNERTKVHVDSQFYDVEAFLNGQCSLNNIELEQLGNVEGRSLLHLQCHFGQDSLSWARKGALVTGVDLSNEAIEQAKRLNDSLDLNATFIAKDIYQFGSENAQQFDIVYTSYGVLCWLPDLDKWAEVVARSLNAGGVFHLVEFHTVNDLLSGYSYFGQREPDIEEEGTYTENGDDISTKVMTWPHAISEVINALINAGLIIEQFNEFPYSPYKCFEGLEHVQGKGFEKRYQGQQVPLVYSIQARKPA